MKPFLFTIVLALVAGNLLGLGWYKSETAYEWGASPRPSRVEMPHKLRFAEQVINMPAVTIRGKRASAPKHAESVLVPPTMHCGPWRALEQGSGKVQECLVY